MSTTADTNAVLEIVSEALTWEPIAPSGDSLCNAEQALLCKNEWVGGICLTVEEVVDVVGLDRQLGLGKLQWSVIVSDGDAEPSICDLGDSDSRPEAREAAIMAAAAWLLDMLGALKAAIPSLGATDDGEVAA